MILCFTLKTFLNHLFVHQGTATRYVQAEKTNIIAFPEGFLWGATLLAHQVEGGNYAGDWWRWEQRPGRIRDGGNSQMAADHARRYEEDFELAGRLGLRALFFSIAWSRVQPAPNSFDEAAIEQYRTMLHALTSRRIEPVCVLYHGVSPSWFTASGGWRRPEAPEAFSKYAARMAAEFAGECQWWIPFHEPMEGIRMAYIEGLWPPGKRNPVAAYRVAQHVKRAHARAYEAIHAARSDVSVGVALRGRACEPQDPDRSWDVRALQYQEAWPRRFLSPPSAWLRWPLHETARTYGAADPPLDFLGVGFYGRETVRFTPLRWRQGCAQYTDREGRTVPAGSVEPDARSFERVLHDMGRYRLPLLITGNGIATSDDAARCAYLLDHLAVVHRALEQGLDIRGYFHRAFLDGFEWTQGYTARYGLVHVARESLARTPNPSAYLYRDICESGTIRRGTVTRFYPEWDASTEKTMP
jgi:beta-glucosidase